MTPWWRGSEREDSSAIVGLQSPLVMVAAVVVCGGFLILGLASGDLERPGLYGAAFVAMGVAWALLLRAPGTPLPRWVAAAALAAEVVAVVGVVVAAEPLTRAPLMPLAGATAIGSALLCLRGRVDAAWLGLALLLTVLAAAGSMHGGDAMFAIVVVAPGNLGILTLMTVFAAVIGPRAAQIFALRRQARRESAVIAARAVRDQQLARLDERVRPLLQRIARGDRLDARDLAHCRLVEAQLRDRIRAPGLDVPTLSDAAWAARVRGVRVLFLDDRSTSDAVDAADDRIRIVEQLSGAAVTALRDAPTSSTVTVRLLPAGRPAAATVSVSADGAVHLQEFS